MDPVGAKERTDRFAGGVGEAVGEGEVRGDRHGFALAKRAPRRQPMQSYLHPVGARFYCFYKSVINFKTGSFRAIFFSIRSSLTFPPIGCARRRTRMSPRRTARRGRRFIC